ncbi:MAG: ribosome maturation factor rimM [Pseudomonadota bacterium]
MVIPVNSDKPVTTGSDRTTQSRQEMTREQIGSQRSDSTLQGTPGTETKPDVETARHLYQLENNPLETVRSGIETPEQARSLLNQLLQQFSAAPEAALKTQGSGSNNLLGNLLSAAPT